MKEKTLILDCDLRILNRKWQRVQPAPAKTAEKAENHNKKGPINATEGKSGISIWKLLLLLLFMSSFKNCVFTGLWGK